MMQEVIVAAIVVFAAWMVLRRYLPKSAKRVLRVALVGLMKRCGLKKAADRIERRAEAAAASCADGCGSCGGCGPKGKGPAQTKFAITPEALKRTASR
ncbi:DUF6587 family protein [Herbaspirillum sp. ST 5-3]|uniref:DUF6587 family protein n=1 Tax=Oxalobacteraceae TaxID=75682 RepID=UPI0010A542AF|nr:DUF6587 family protein [Herbaspirillum sp. ST 5-3]